MIQLHFLRCPQCSRLGLEFEPQAQVANGEAAGGPPRRARLVATHFLVTASGDAAAASAAVTEWSSKPLVQGVTDVIWSQWLAHHAGDADGARVAIDMFSDGGVFYGRGVFDAGRWYAFRPRPGTRCDGLPAMLTHVGRRRRRAQRRITRLSHRRRRNGRRRGRRHSQSRRS